MTKLVLFDGECNFCDSSVQFILKRDTKGVFKFASLQSEVGLQIIKQHEIPRDMESFVLVDDDKAYYKSSAALHVCKNLKGLWKTLFIFIIIPRPIRNIFYNIVADNRYKWFGKKESCMIPSPEIRNRFIQDPSDLK